MIKLSDSKKAKLESIERKLDVGRETGNDYYKWAVRSSNDYPYQKSFLGVLKGRSIQSLVRDAKAKTGKALVLDLMGYGDVLRKLPIDAGLAIALEDPRRTYDKNLDKEKNITLLEGNILKRNTWNKIDEWLHNKNAEVGFNLILCRPVRGLSYLTEQQKVHITLLQRLWKLLNSNGGRLITQIQDRLFPSLLMFDWINMLNQMKGIRADYCSRTERDDYVTFQAFLPVISLIKRKGAPDTLPIDLHHLT